MDRTNTISYRRQDSQIRRQDDGYRFLMASVIERAIDDLKGIGPDCHKNCHKKETDYAMAFILSETCETWCLELKIDYERIREKAVELYQRFIAKNDILPANKKRSRKPAKHLKGVQIRQSPGKRRIATGR